jgi:hypothetical protein
MRLAFARRFMAGGLFYLAIPAPKAFEVEL